MTLWFTLILADVLALQGAVERYLVPAHRGAPVGQVEVVVVGPAVGRDGALGEAVQLARGVVEDGEDARGVAGDDGVLDVFEERVDEALLLLGRQARGRVRGRV